MHICLDSPSQWQLHTANLALVVFKFISLLIQPHAVTTSFAAV